MKPARPERPAPDPAAGIHALEHYLAVATERTRARHAAEAFADRMPHLTTTERRQLVSLYAHEAFLASQRLRMELAWQRAAHDARDLLRRRCVTVALLVSLACGGLALFTLQALTAH
ncbi:hypothetical protein ACWD04_32360 [Streptomyces sp. NPDC002911]